MNEALTYEQAFNELSELVSDIESGNINIDELSEKVKRAGFLINICKQKLVQTEKEVGDILKNFQDSEN